MVAEHCIALGVSFCMFASGLFDRRYDVDVHRFVELEKTIQLDGTTQPQFNRDYVQDEITDEWIVRYPK